MCNTVTMMDGEFFFPFAVVKLPDFDDASDRGYHKVFSIGTELGICKKPPRILDDDFFLPLVVLKPPDFADAITRGCHKVVSIGAEASTHHSCRMPEGNFFTPLAALKLPEFGVVVEVLKTVRRYFPSGLKLASLTSPKCPMVAMFR